jgi:hypothetical protein
MQGASSYFNGPHYRILAIVCQATCKHLDPWGSGAYRVQCTCHRKVHAFRLKPRAFLTSIHRTNPKVCGQFHSWGCAYFRKRTEPAMPVLNTPRTVQGYVEGTKLALCARAQTQNRSGRIEGLQIPGSSDCPKFRLTIQKEKITI